MEITGVQAIAWDLDGTLLDSFGVYTNILTEVMQTRGVEMPSPDVLAQHYHGTLDESIQNALGLATLEEADEIVSHFLSIQDKHYGDPDSHLFTDAVQLAEAAANQELPQLIITNRHHERRGSASPRAIVAGSVLASFIHEIRCGDEVTHTKPDRRSIEDWLETENIPPEELLVIGDQWPDAQLAENFGARALLVHRGGTIPHIEELVKTMGKRLMIVADLTEVSLR